MIGYVGQNRDRSRMYLIDEIGQEDSKSSVSCERTTNKPKRAIKGSFTSRQSDGTLIGLEFHGTVDKIVGDFEKVCIAVLKGEMHGNGGQTRVHIFLE